MSEMRGAGRRSSRKAADFQTHATGPCGKAFIEAEVGQRHAPSRKIALRLFATMAAFISGTLHRPLARCKLGERPRRGRDGDEGSMTFRSEPVTRLGPRATGPCEATNKEIRPCPN